MNDVRIERILSEIKEMINRGDGRLEINEPELFLQFYVRIYK